MELLAWFEDEDYFDTNVKAALTDEAPCGLNLEQVLSAHIAWHERFIEVMHGANDAGFELTKVYQDNHGSLGKWLHGEAQVLFGHLSEYDAVCKAYAEFHGCAGVALGQHRMGNEEYAQELLKTKYRSAFNKVKIEFVHLFSAARFKPFAVY